MKLDWRQGLLKLAVMGMEWCWLTAFLYVLNVRVANSNLSILVLWLLYPLSFDLNWLLGRTRLPKITLYAINGLALVAGILLMVKVQIYGSLGFSQTLWLVAIPRAFTQILYSFEPEILILLSGILLWILGWRLSRTRVTIAIVATEFQFGIALLLIAYFSASMLNLEFTIAPLLALAFFLFALPGMAVAYAQEGTGWSAALHKGLWVWLLVGSIGLIIVLGFVLGSASPELAQLVVLPLRWLWNTSLIVMDFLVKVFPLPDWAKDLPKELMIESGELPPEKFTEALGLPEWLVRSGRSVWTVVVLGLIVVAIWRVSSQLADWLRHRTATTSGAEVVAIKSTFNSDFLKFIKRIFQRLLGLFGLKVSSSKRKEAKPLPPEVASVREIYRELLYWVASNGWPRLAYQTPYEYLGTLERLLPASRDSLRLITDWYVNTRYGLLLPGKAQLDQLKQSWHKLKQSRIEGSTKYEKELPYESF